MQALELCELLTLVGCIINLLKQLERCLLWFIRIRYSGLLVAGALGTILALLDLLHCFEVSWGVWLESEERGAPCILNILI